MLVALLVLLSIVVTVYGPLETYVAGSRWSISRPNRALGLAAVIAALRYWLDPRYPSLRVLFRRDSAESAGPAPQQESRSALLSEVVLVTLGFGLFVAAWTWPQMANLHGVPDFGDPLFSTWRIAWIAHQVVRDPLTLFDGNIFYPERLTLTYSDPVIVPALMSAPFISAGVHQLTAYNLLLLSGFVFSGVTMYFLLRRLTGRRGAAVVGATIFAMCPYRFEHYSHLELQMTMWMPLVLLGLHRTMASGHLRDGILTGTAFGLQTLSSLYYGCYLAVYLVPIAAVLWLARGRPTAPIRALAAGAVVAGLMAAPVAYQYVRNKPMLGERQDTEVAFYSAVPSDYFEAHFRSRFYGKRLAGGSPERQLFPGVAPIALSAVALWPPLNTVRLAYGLGLVLAFDGSLGVHGTAFPALREWVPPFRGLRVPARFALLVSFTLAVLSAIGAALLLSRAGRWRVPVTVVFVALIAVEQLPVLELETAWSAPPDIYGSLDERSPAVLAEFPMPVDPAQAFTNARYMYFSTFHWQRLVNGTSGFHPPSYFELTDQTADFPSRQSIEYLRERGVEYVGVHGAFMSERRFRRTVRALRRIRGVELIAERRWNGSESHLYRIARRR